MAINVNIPPLKVPPSIAEKLSPDAFQFLNELSFSVYQLYRRTGGANDGIDEVQIGELYEPGLQSFDPGDIEDLQNKIDSTLLSDALDRIEELENKIGSSLTGTDDEIELMVGIDDRLYFNDSWICPELITVTSDFTTTGSQLIICNNTADITITANLTPDELERIYIKRANTGKVYVSSSKGIDGETTKAIISQYDCPLIVYTTSLDAWSII